MSDSVWTLEPALMVERIATVIPPQYEIAFVRSPRKQIQVIAPEMGVLLRGEPENNAWRVRAWVAEAGLEPVTAELALEVLAAQDDACVFESTMTQQDVLKAHSSSELKPAALWSYLRRTMEQARLAFDTKGLRAKIPALQPESAMVVPGRVQISGLWEGYRFEFRVQYGSASLTANDPHLASDPLWFAGMYFDKWDTPNGETVPSWDQIEPVFLTLARRLERAPFVYLFRRVSPSDDEAPWESSGQSAEDAFENLLARVSRLRDQGYLSGADNGIFYPQPLNEDIRRFPAVQPKFEVLP